MPFSNLKPWAAKSQGTANPADLLHIHCGTASSPGNKSHLCFFFPPPHQQKKPKTPQLLEPSVLKDINNWGSRRDDSCNYIPDQKPEPFLAARTHEVFRGWCPAEKTQGLNNGWVGGLNLSPRVGIWFSHPNGQLSPGRRARSI